MTADPPFWNETHVRAVGHFPPTWLAACEPELQRLEFTELTRFLAQRREEAVVFPAPENVFHALRRTPLDSVRVVILGQDPYHGAGQAHGLSFSVPSGVKHPPSLANIFKELASDLGREPPASGDLSGWADQGVLMLNTVLTVEEGQAHSHRGKGWEPFTDHLIRCVDARENPAVFVLWGKPAQTKQRLFERASAKRTSSTVICGPHPSPLSAFRGFFGSRPFSQVNAALEAQGEPPIDW